MTDASVALAQQIEDFRLEAIALDRVLAHMPLDTWHRATSFKAWTIWDVVAHLHMGDTMGFLTLTDPQSSSAKRTLVIAARCPVSRSLGSGSETLTDHLC